jgi:hypothetical protein
MNKLVACALSLPLLACVVGDTSTGDDGSGGGGGGGGGKTTDHITANTTWTGAVDVARQTVVDPGATLTIAAGATVKLAAGVGITVQGIVDVQGTKASVVRLSPASAGEHHNGFSVAAGGELKMVYAVQSGGGIETTGATAKVTVSDTLMSRAGGDFLVVYGGTVTVSYSSIGLEPGPDTTHCDMHFGGNGNTIKITHSNVSNTPYGLMLYGGASNDLTYNNWFGNGIDIDADPGVMGDVSFGWFEKGTPVVTSGATLVANSLAGARLVDAGPR